MISYGNFLINLNRVREEITEACEFAKRPINSVLILPVTKTYPFQIIEYVKQAGLNAVGENRIQEAAEKKCYLKNQLNWELIGHLQSNKIDLAINTSNRIQSIDSQSLLKKINKSLEKIDKIFPILLQVNVSDDPAKYGVK